MAIKHSHFRGHIKLKGRPKEQAKAEIMMMNAEWGLKQKKMRRFLFTILDIILVLSLILTILCFYQGSILNGILTLLVGIIILSYYLIRRGLKNKKSKKERR